MYIVVYKKFVAGRMTLCFEALLSSVSVGSTIVAALIVNWTLLLFRNSN